MRTATEPATLPDEVRLAPSWWAPATTQRERLAAGPVVASPGPTTDRAARRLARWRAEHDLAASGMFAVRLGAAGLTEPELTALLDESPASVAARVARPAWAVAVEDILATMPEPAAEPDCTPAPNMSTIVAPFRRFAVASLLDLIADSGLSGHSDGDGPQWIELDKVLDGLAGQITATLVGLAARTLVLELNVLRVTGRLDGGTGEQRYASFVRQLQRPDRMIQLCAEYPVLARLLAVTADRFAVARAELLARYAADRADIVSTLLGGADPGPLVEVHSGGDTHQGGRTVALLRFANGIRVVYKPRSLTVHRHFNDLVGWLNARQPGLDLRRLAVLDRPGYGWIEYAEAGPCADTTGVGRYYHRQGALLALLYILGGADFHYENLIACADQPVLVDLEALLHPVVRPSGPAWLLDDPAMGTLDSSVARTAILPLLLVGEDGAVDLSGLGGDKGTPMPVTSVAWQHNGTDEMRLTREHALFGGALNRPTLDRVDADPAQYLDHLMDGFTTAYTRIVEHRDELVGRDGLLWSFERDEIRVVVRATRVYAKLADESTHPDLMRDALDRDRILDYLWAVSAEDQVRQRLIGGEVDEIWSGDVPLFHARPGATELWDGRGTAIHDTLDEPSIVSAARRIAELGSADLDRQLWIIRASMASRPVAALPTSPRRSLTDPAEAGPTDPDRLLAQARRLGDELCRTACAGSDRVSWLGLEQVPQQHWLVRPLGIGLLSGTPGVALFLAQLAAVTGEERYARMCRRALAPARAIVDGLLAPSPRYSPFVASVLLGLDGASGLAYALTASAAMLGEPCLANPVDALLGLVADSLGAADVDPPYDIINGSAGTLAVATAIFESTGSAQAARTTAMAAARLLTLGSDAQPSGFGRGTSGAGWALLRHAAVTGDEDSRAVGLDLLAAGQACLGQGCLGHKSLGHKSLVDSDADRSWIHGSTGTGLARMADLPAIADLAVAREITAPPLANHSLCHGEVGAMELLSRGGGGSLGARQWRTEQLLRELEQVGPRCATPDAVTTPALLTGLAGIGHGLLRLARPEEVPSVLLLEIDPSGRPA